MARKRSTRHKLEAAVARINARLGRQTVTRGRSPPILDTPTSRTISVPHIPTGFPDLDDALCTGGN
jgi:hypothetical protein